MTITMLTSGVLGLLLGYLSILCSKQRVRTKTILGSGDEEGIQRTIRAQANLVEYAPMAVILIGLLEYADVHSLVVLVLAALFVTARLAHAFGMANLALPNVNAFRFMGTVLTFTSIFILSGLVILVGIGIL